MDLAKLELLSSETLQAIRDKCAEVLKSRGAGALRVGGHAWFLDNNGRKRYAIIERINAKSVSCKEIDAHGAPLPMKWKVGPSMLNPILDKSLELSQLAFERERREKDAAALREADKPKEVQDTW